MALLIQNPEAERLLRQRAEETGERVDEVVLKALQARYESAVKWEKKIFAPGDPAFSKALREIQDRVVKLPVLDDRTPDEILGYDEWGCRIKWWSIRPRWSR